MTTARDSKREYRKSQFWDRNSLVCEPGGTQSTQPISKAVNLQILILRNSEPQNEARR